MTTKKRAAKPSTSGNSIYGKQRLISYVVDWDIPKNIKWEQLDHVAYAFAEPNEKGELGSYTDSNLKASK